MIRQSLAAQQRYPFKISTCKTSACPKRTQRSWSHAGGIRLLTDNELPGYARGYARKR